MEWHRADQHHQHHGSGAAASLNAMKPPLRDRAWLSVAAERGVGACNKALRMFYVG